MIISNVSNNYQPAYVQSKPAFKGSITQRAAQGATEAGSGLIRKALPKAVGTVTGFFGTILNKARGLAGGAVKGVKGAVDCAAKAVRGFAGGVFKGAKGIVDAGVKGVKGIVGGAVKGVKTAADTAVKGVKGAVDGVIKRVKGAVDGAVKRVKGVTDSIFHRGSKNVEAVAEEAQEGAQKAKKPFFKRFNLNFLHREKPAPAPEVTA